jgi:hypothetical protein
MGHGPIITEPAGWCERCHFHENATTAGYRNDRRAERAAACLATDTGSGMQFSIFDRVRIVR